MSSTPQPKPACKRLFLVRHAMAMPTGTDDFHRELAPQGKEDAKALGKALAQKQYSPDLVLCSPALRTQKTLACIEKTLSVANMQSPEIIYSGTVGDYLYEIQKTDNAVQNLMLVGHNPAVYELAILLAGHGQDSLMSRLAEGYKPAMMVVLHCPCEAWKDIQPAEAEIVDILDPLDYNAPARPTRWT